MSREFHVIVTWQIDKTRCQETSAVLRSFTRHQAEQAPFGECQVRVWVVPLTSVCSGVESVTIRVFFLLFLKNLEKPTFGSYDKRYINKFVVFWKFPAYLVTFLTFFRFVNKRFLTDLKNIPNSAIEEIWNSAVISSLKFVLRRAIWFRNQNKQDNVLKSPITMKAEKTMEIPLSMITGIFSISW